MQNATNKERTILGGIKTFLPNGRRTIKVDPRDLRRWASDAVSFADEEKFVAKDPILDAPNRARGGVCYFQGGIPRPDLSSEMYTLGIDPDLRKYTAVYLKADDPKTAKYYSQMRILTSMALFEYYEAVSDSDCETWPAQVCAIGEAIWRFITSEQNRYSGAMHPPLGFGLIVERNVPVELGPRQTTSGVYRIWSRPVNPTATNII